MTQIQLLQLLIFLAAGALFGNAVAQGGEADAADEIHLFYLHGRIIEDEGPRPIHPTFGLYDYPAIVDALGERGATVLSEIRAPGTSVDEYARKITGDIEGLIGQGVSPNQIVVAGFSKGGGIAIQTSHLLVRPDVRYVLMAACADWITSYPDLHLSGRVLSIYEASDELGTTCANLAARGDAVTGFEEMKISTGKQHGAFYLPRPIWVEPLLDWVHGAGAASSR